MADVSRVIIEVVGSPTGRVWVTVEQPPNQSRTKELDTYTGARTLDILQQLMEEW